VGGPGATYRCGVLPDLSFHVVGVSHHTARVEERERFALSSSETAEFLREQQQSGRSGLLLSTCNRCEYYWCGNEDGEARLRGLARTRGALDTMLTRHDGTSAVRHLFIVAAGLDSQVLGETEILGQVRRAYDLARAAGTTTPVMDLILSGALAAGRRVRRETMLGRHPASVSSAAVDLVIERWGSIGSRGVVVLGGGEAAEGILRAVHERGARNVTLLTRRPVRARALADAWGASSGNLSQLEEKLDLADLLVVATSAARPIVTSEELTRVAARRGNRDLFVIDMGVPRNVDPAARNISAVQLFDLDDLQRLSCPAAGTPSVPMIEVDRLIDEELARLAVGIRARVAGPKLAELHRFGVEMARQESAWALAQLNDLSDEQREIIREMADRLVRRVLYPVSRTIRSDHTPTENIPREEPFSSPSTAD
jgi:glutamyl-tRNA reductase